MDTCVIPLRHGGLSLVQTTDYIYPIVDDPYMMVGFRRSLCLCIERVTQGLFVKTNTFGNRLDSVFFCGFHHIYVYFDLTWTGCVYL